jgi:hypothetical protein
VSNDLDAAVMNEAVVKVPWEGLEPGPVGEYLEVVDADPASDAFYLPVDLNDPHLLAQDGHAPSETNPQFHQQMVYAVAMTTIGNFERALGRRIFWSPRFYRHPEDNRIKEAFVRRLRVYPHALREPNAYYSPQKKALLFGYFAASRERPGRNLPGGTVFTCLSHDVVAHETAHAVLDGMHRRYVEPSNVDALAFHEAFADIVALMQHFTLPEAVRHQIEHLRGDLSRRSLLSDLARQFGEAIGQGQALRSGIEAEDPGAEPDPTLLARTTEPHARGLILVRAVFDAFLTIYHARIADLLRLTTGDGRAYPGLDLHPDLANRLTAEANKAAGHILRICIRALDYLPPVDVTFGEFLRAIITADADLVPDDPRGYRLAIIEAFRRRGIYPVGIRSLAADGLLWECPGDTIGEIVLPWLDDIQFRYSGDRAEIWATAEHNRLALWRWLMDDKAPRHAEIVRTLGLRLDGETPNTIPRSNRTGLPGVELHSVRLARRTSPNGGELPQLVVEITQRRHGYATREDQHRADEGSIPSETKPAFTFRGGCTLIVDMLTRRVRYCIRKPIDSNRRLEEQRRFLFEAEGEGLAATYFALCNHPEPFAMLHRHQ